MFILGVIYKSGLHLAYCLKVGYDFQLLWRHGALDAGKRTFPQSKSAFYLIAGPAAAPMHPPPLNKLNILCVCPAASGGDSYKNMVLTLWHHA